MIVATATAEANRQSVGGVSLILSEGLAVALHASAKAAVEACKVPGLRRLRNRDPRQEARHVAEESVACLASAGAKAASDGGLFEDFIELAEWEGIAEVIEAALKVTVIGLSAAETAKYIVWMAAAAAAAGVVYGTTSIIEAFTDSGPIAKISIPGAGLGTKPSQRQCEMVKGPESPLCLDIDCMSIDNKYCVVPPNASCSCLTIIPQPEFPQWANFTFMNLQQVLIKDFLSIIAKPVPTSATCSPFSHVVSSTSGGEFLFATVAPSYYTCGPGTIVAINLATSGTSTTSYCETGTPAPPGFTRILANNGQPITKTTFQLATTTGGPVDCRGCREDNCRSESPSYCKNGSYQPTGLCKI